MPDRIQMLIEIALQEDIGSGDITSDAIFGDERIEKTGVIVAKEDSFAVIAGLEIARRVFLTVDHHLEWKAFVEDGTRVTRGAKVATVSGRFKSLLRAERTALNFLQHLSGVATLTAQFVERVKGTKAQILDTRKTLPGFRALEKMAVRAGGGKNHRLGLYDRYLIKDNHLMGISISEAVRKAKEHNVNRVPIEVEIQRLDQIDEAIVAGADVLMMDNFTVDELKKAVKGVAGRVKVEASGGIRLDNVREYAESGVDFISVGALTHSAKAVDLSFEIG
ncbi:MAG TPA: carboxylating nicotinate-nucleotide diphosphorylase [bacterium]|nr:carboxylating nicotinate-nucleotide diphosphorylase [bacterium]